MYFRLVKLKAQDKAYIPHSDLTNLNQMIAYYEGKGDKKMLPEIYYLAGSTHFDLHDSPQALDYYHKVLDNITADDHLRLWELRMPKLVMSCFIKEIMLQLLTITKFLIELIL